MLRVVVQPVMLKVGVLQVMLWFIVALVTPMIWVLLVVVLAVGLCVAWVVVGWCWAGPAPFLAKGLAGGFAGRCASPVGQMMARVP